MFNPKPEYDIVQDVVALKDFHAYREEYVIRPPYQRKTVWSQKKKQSLLDSLIRRYYVPKLVLREIRIGSDRTLREVIDGQQRISTAIEFFSDNVALPESLASIDTSLAGKKYSKLPVDTRRFVDKELKYGVDLVKGIDDPRNPTHQQIAAEIFWRLQQGETLTYMEIAHARLSSLSRNFVEKYADDISFDYEKYIPVDKNPNKHNFFKLISRSNDRMQHLALLTRLLILEENHGPADIKDTNVMEYIDRYKVDDGIANLSFEHKQFAKQVLKIMDKFCAIFQNDPMISDAEDEEIKELSTEYFIVSFFLLLRHLTQYYSFQRQEETLFREFLYNFYGRWKSKVDQDVSVLQFSSSRQQSAKEVEDRHLILRQLFFEYASKKKVHMNTLDVKRTFDEAERIRIYREGDGLCVRCVSEGKPKREATVSWKAFEADHIMPWVKGGATEEWNGQLLCGFHNKQKSAN